MDKGGPERGSDLPNEMGVLYPHPPALQSSPFLVNSVTPWGTCGVTHKCLPVGICSRELNLKQEWEQGVSLSCGWA